MIKKKIILSAGIFLTVLLYVWGIDWGVPSKEISSLVFGENRVEKFIPAMLESHEEIRDMQVYYGAPYLLEYSHHEQIEIELEEGKREGISKEMINSFRSYLTRSSGADEQAVIASLSKINPKLLKFDPEFYEYGGAYIYPMGIFFYGLSKINSLRLNPSLAFYFLNPDEMGRLFIFGRLFGAVGALLSILIFYLICRELLPEKKLAGILTFIYGISPALVLWSHYLKPFSFGMFWFLLSLWTAIKFHKTERDKWLYLSSVFAGVSFGTLLSYGYVYLAVILVISFSTVSCARKTKNLLLSLFIFLAIFFIINPYVLISRAEFLQELSYLREYWQGSVAIPFSLRTFTFNTLRYGLGNLLWLFLLIGLLGSIVFRPKKIDIFFLLLILPGLLYFSLKTTKWVHYSICLHPLLMISSGLFASRIGLKKAVITVICIVAGYTFLYSASYVKILGDKNIRVVAGEWINENILPDRKIGLLESPSPWRTPPFRFMNYDIVITAEKDVIEKQPEYFIVSEYQWLRGMGFSAMEALLSDYEIVERFERPPSIMGITFRYGEDIPYDWCHPNPKILIWKRKE